jgi:hypothetical protein
LELEGESTSGLTYVKLNLLLVVAGNHDRAE